MSKDTGGPAFPIQGQQFTLGDKTYEPSVSGMTLRDYFAAKAMQGMATKSRVMIHDEKAFTDLSPSVIAQIAYQTADAMLAERAK